MGYYQTELGTCVISGFHLKLEKDVLHFLLKEKQPIILVLGRQIYKKMADEFLQPLNEGRMLIVSPVLQKRKDNQKTTALTRNKYIIEHSGTLVFGCLNEKSSLYPLYQKALEDKKNVMII